MKSFKIIFGMLLLAATFASCASNKNAFKNEKVTVYGNCEQCENRIETAGTIKKTATVDWDQTTKLATISFDTTKTNLDEILARIARAGHDSDAFLAPDKVYNALPGCCKYDRTSKPAMSDHTDLEMVEVGDTTHPIDPPVEEGIVTEKPIDYLASVFANYFALKDGLVQTSASSTAANAKKLLSSLNSVKMETLSTSEHTAWMNVKANLIADAKSISESSDVEAQRTTFIRLSEKMYALAKSAELEKPVYYQFCPMANNGKGATWLSKENTVKNPYYGATMLTCGKVTETIK